MPYMLEVEAKVAIDKTEDQVEMAGAARNMLEKIRKLGGEGFKEIEQWDLYLEHPCRDFNKLDEAFRIRGERNPEETDWDIKMTYKGPKLSDLSKARVEREIDLQKGTQLQDVQDMLSSIGLEVAGEVKKIRWSLQLDDFHIFIDQVEGLGTYLEVELMSVDLQGAEKKILEFLDSLGLEKRERRSYVELLKGENLDFEG